MTLKRRFSQDEAMSLLREELELRRVEWRRLAVKAGVSLRWVYDFAEGKYEGVSLDRVTRLAQAMECPFEIVFIAKIPLSPPTVRLPGSSGPGMLALGSTA